MCRRLSCLSSLLFLFTGVRHLDGTTKVEPVHQSSQPEPPLPATDDGKLNDGSTTMDGRLIKIKIRKS